MSEIIERMARAMLAAQNTFASEETCDSVPTPDWDHISERRRRGLLAEARAALPAMREPTKAMVSAGDECLCHFEFPAAHAEEAWQAMIDAALK